MTTTLDAPATPTGTGGVNHPAASNPPAAPRQHRSPPRGAAGAFKHAPQPFERIPGASDLDFYTNNPITIDKETGMPLPTAKTSRTGRDPRDARILIAGPPKVGKTTLLAQWAPDSTLILDTHQGTRLLDGDHYVQPIATFADFERVVDEIVAGNHKFRTIGIDLIEDVYKLADRQAAVKNGQLAAGLVEYGKGTAEAEALFRRAIDKLLASSYGIWFLGHTESVQDDNKVKYVARIDKRVKTYVEGVCEYLLLAEAHGPVRKLHTAPSARFQAGSRTPLPEPMDLDARALYAAIKQGLAAPKPAPAPAPETTSDSAAVAQEPIAA